MKKQWSGWIGFHKDKYSSTSWNYVSVSIVPGPQKRYAVSHRHEQMYREQVVTDEFEKPCQAQYLIGHLIDGNVFGLQNINRSKLEARKMLEHAERHGYAIFDWKTIQTGVPTPAGYIPPPQYGLA